MTRKLRVRLLGDGWGTYGGLEIPESREMVVTEAEAAAFLKNRTTRDSIEVIERFDDDDEDAPPAEPDT